MTNTNLLRCGRVPFSSVWATAPGFSHTCPELSDGPGESGLITAIGPWVARLRTGRRPAMEVYEYGELLDVVVDSPLGGSGLRGARRDPFGGPGRGPVSCAWGRLPPCGTAPPVRFLTGGLRRRAAGAAAVRVTGRFWFGSTAGQFRWARLPTAAGCACADRPARGRTT
ncbi:hypothetical protein [Kitasatospora sp. NPDC004272]